MGTTNGFGTLYYDWEAGPDDTAEATKWLVAAFFPILPLGRHRLHVHSSGTKPSFFSLGLTKTPFALPYDVLETVPTTAVRLLKTYVMGWIVTPLILLIPMFVMCAILFSIKPPANGGQQPMASLQQSVLGWGTLAVFIWCGVVVSWILDRATGRHLARDNETATQTDPD